MDRTRVSSTIIMILFLGSLPSFLAAPVSNSSSGVCEAHCDSNEDLVERMECDVTSGERCCGTTVWRYCCSQPDRWLTGPQEVFESCPNSEWWLYQWEVIVTILGVVVGLLLCTTTCYVCCSKCWHRAPESIRRRMTRNSTVSSISRAGTVNSNPDFNPDSPYAFRPPPYDQVPKKPPGYRDVLLSDIGRNNLALDPEIGPIRENLRKSVSEDPEAVIYRRKIFSQISVHGEPPPAYRVTSRRPSQVSVDLVPARRKTSAVVPPVSDQPPESLRRSRSTTTLTRLVKDSTELPPRYSAEAEPPTHS